MTTVRPRAEGWKTVRVFISSTFLDMQAERDYLVRFVFPRMREELITRRIHLIDVDLRWGVTPDQDALEVCREVVDECRPRFLCMLGRRSSCSPTYFPPVRSVGSFVDKRAGTLGDYPMARLQPPLPHSAASVAPALWVTTSAGWRTRCTRTVDPRGTSADRLGKNSHIDVTTLTLPQKWRRSADDNDCGRCGALDRCQSHIQKGGHPFSRRRDHHFHAASSTHASTTAGYNTPTHRWPTGSTSVICVLALKACSTCAQATRWRTHRIPRGHASVCPETRNRSAWPRVRTWIQLPSPFWPDF